MSRFGNGGLRSVPSDPWINLDGRLNAPAGPAQFPAILNGYPTASPPNARTRWPNNGTQPPWAVAGVDYAVGATGVLTDPWPGYPATTSGSFASGFLTQCGGFGNLSVSGSTITVNGLSNATISNWDFSTHGGISLELSGCTNVTINNCNWLFTTNTGLDCLDIVGGSLNTSVLYCTLNNGGFNGFDAAVCMLGNLTAGLVVKYCYFLNCGGDAISVTSGVSIVQFNLFKDIGQQSGAHPDLVQHVVPTPPATSNDLISFNTLYENSNNLQEATQGFTVGDNNVTASGANFITNNTAVLIGANPSIPACSSFISPVGQFATGATLLVSQNYINVADETPSPVLLFAFNYAGNTAFPQITLSKNILMADGTIDT